MRRITVLGLAGVGLLLAGCDYSFQGGGQVNITPLASPPAAVTATQPSVPALSVPRTSPPATATPTPIPQTPTLTRASPWTAAKCSWALAMLGPGPEPSPDNFPVPSPWPPGWPPPDYDAMRDATVPQWKLPTTWTAQDTDEIGWGTAPSMFLYTEVKGICAQPPVLPSKVTIQTMITVTADAQSLHECNNQPPAMDSSNCDNGNPPGYNPGNGERVWAVEWDLAWIHNYGQLIELMQQLL